MNIQIPLGAIRFDNPTDEDFTEHRFALILVDNTASRYWAIGEWESPDPYENWAPHWIDANAEFGSPDLVIRDPVLCWFPIVTGVAYWEEVRRQREESAREHPQLPGIEYYRRASLEALRTDRIHWAAEIIAGQAVEDAEREALAREGLLRTRDALANRFPESYVKWKNEIDAALRGLQSESSPR